MNRSLICLLGLLYLHSPVLPQYYFSDDGHLEPELRWEAGFSLGLMNCLTDLGGQSGKGKKFLKDINWNNSRPSGGLFVTATIHEAIAFRLETTLGQVKADDGILKNDQSEARSRYRRNLHFRSQIMEASVIVEVHPLIFFQRDQLPLVSPYLAAGLGYFSFNPKARLDDNWIELHPLHTEGQGFREFPGRELYKLQQLSCPVGGGLKYEVSTFIVVRLEFEYRFLFTDYLDDVSDNYIDPALFYKYFQPSQARIAEKLADRQRELDPFHTTTAGYRRGNPQSNDTFFSISLKLSVVMNRRPYR